MLGCALGQVNEVANCLNPAFARRTFLSVTKQPKVGDHVTVSLHTGRLVDGRLQVDYGKDETALVHLWQVHPEDMRVGSECTCLC
jgi:hypothetical protein